MHDLTRRDALAGLSVVSGVAFAGCLSNSESDGPNGDDPENGEFANGTDDDDPLSDDDGSSSTELELVDSSLESGEASAGGSDWVSATVDGSTLTFEGATPTPNPCQRAVLNDVTFDGGQLSLTVGVEPDPSEGGICPAVISSLKYTATCEFSDDIGSLDTFDSVVVDHEYVLGGTHTVVDDGSVVEEFAGAPPTSDPVEPAEFPPVADYSITTFGCESTGSTDIGSGDAETSIDDGTVSIEGHVVVPTPCHEATVEAVAGDGDTLSVTVGARSTLDDEFCVQQVCRLSYEATLTLAEGVSVSEATVSHEIVDDTQ